MLNFTPITLGDRAIIDPVLRRYNCRSCDCSFTNNFIWSHAYDTQFAIYKNFVCIRSGKEPYFYTNPIGEGDYGAVIKALVADAVSREISFTLRGILKCDAARLNCLFGDIFEITENRFDFDYIYSVNDLTTLAGKKYASKRNHIARFTDNPDWTYEPITPRNIDECYEMNENWFRCNENNCHEDLILDHNAVRRFLKYYFKLGLHGGLLRLGGRVIAFTIGEPLCNDTYDIFVEKAYHDIQGAYQMINREFLCHECQDYLYVNREEDMGNEGLRKAKLSYHPRLLLEKYTAVLKEGRALV